MYPTFARTRPPDTQISKSVASLLLSFGWMKVAFLYSTTQDRNFKEVSRTIIQTLDGIGIEVRYLGTWPETYHYGYGENPFDELVENSYMNARKETCTISSPVFATDFVSNSLRPPCGGRGKRDVQYRMSGAHYPMS
ncbi:ANF_receptor domain-containing protein [Caerostris extrusa]|uniref:ANF_receptor domain-containing protein n=1 Tax=Caerostris extrusa TaxID=172846 RepID=A0AAV4UFM7_CAEEX|nr:ANF_receptor domain-containing protein [Caerostris extrusa]